jgi:hypothetical protein
MSRKETLEIMKILVIGGFDLNFKPGDEIESFARALGKAIASRGDTLLNGCFNDFDRVVAEAVLEESTASSVKENELLVESFVAANAKPAHRIGRLRKLRINSWDMGQEGWDIPEPVAECDAVVVVGGGPGTLRGAHLSSLASKPLLPVTAFGGAAVEIFHKELSKFDQYYSGKLSKDTYTALDEQFPDDLGKLAESVLEMATRITSGNSVFVIMGYDKKLDDTFHTVRRVVMDFEYECDRMDMVADTERIFPRMISGIRNAALVIADLSIASNNVYYELGYAEALEKGPIVIAREGSKLPFDINDLPTTFYEDQTRLEEKLRARVRDLSGRTAISKT